MPPASTASAPSPLARWLTWPYRLLMLVGACAGFTAIWVILAWSKGSQCSWMALLGALDVAWILRVVHWPAGLRRAVVGVIATVAIAATANWWIIAAQLGAALGLDPVESALRLGVHHAWVLAGLANDAVDAAWIAAALALAAFTSR